MTGLIQRPTQALAAFLAAVALLMVLAATPAQARTGGLMAPAMLDFDYSQVGRGLLQNSNGQAPVASLGTQCAQTAYKPTIPGPGVSDAFASAESITWTQLQGMGWDLPPNRTASSNINSTTSSNTFYSVQCEGRKRVMPSRTQCSGQMGGTNVDNTKMFGASHLRYDCSSGTLWVLTYVFTDRFLVDTDADQWASTCPEFGTSACDGQGEGQFMKVSGTTQCDASTTACPPINNGTTPPRGGWCCQDMWKVTTDAGVYIGWVGKARVQFAEQYNTTYAGLIVHMEASLTYVAPGGQGATTTPITSGGPNANTVCLSKCAAPTNPNPNPGDLCQNLPTVSVAALTSPAVCAPPNNNVEFNFTVGYDSTAGQAAVALTPTPTPAPADGSCSAAIAVNNGDDTYVYTVTCPVGTTSVKFNLTQTLTTGCRSPSAEATATRTIKTRPGLTAAGPAEPQTVCSLAQDKVVPFTLTSSVTGQVVSVTGVTLGCTAEPRSVTTSGQVNVTCPMTAPFNQDYTITLTAAAGDSDCQGTATSSAIAVTVQNPPTVTVTGPTGPQTACSADSDKVVPFTLTSSVEGQEVQVTRWSVTPVIEGCSLIPADGQVVSGGQVNVSCPISAETPNFAVRLTAAAGGSCAGTDDETVSVSVLVKPTVNVVLVEGVEGDDNVKFCSTEDVTTFTFTVTSDVLREGEKIRVATEEPCKLANNQLTGEADNNANIILRCTKPADGWPASFTPTLKAMAGAETCSTETTGTVSPTVTPIPDVTVEIQGPIADKCSSETGTFSFPAKVYNLGGSTGTMTVTATWGAAPGEACSVSPNTAVTNGSTVTITCGQASPATTYAGGDYPLTVTATAGVTGCSDDGSATASLNVNPKPTITMSGPTEGQVCSDEPSYSFMYNIESTNGFNFNLDMLSRCQPDTGRSNVTSGTVNITCQKGTGWPANSLTVDVSATAGAEGCKNTTTLSNAITINTRPQVSVTAVEPTVNDCASGNSRNFTFTVTGLGSQGTPTYTPTWTVNPSSTPGLTTDCSAFSVSGSTVTVRCISSGTLPESFSVSLAIESGATGCRASASATTQVTLSGCCVSGANTDTAFATVQTGEQLVAASNPGRAACFLDTAAGPWPSDCSMRWGWRNEFTGPGELTANLYAGAAKGCKNLNKLVGTMKVTCANDGGNARVVLWKPDNFGIMPPDNHYYVGCRDWLDVAETKTVKKTPACTPPSFNAPKDTAKYGAVAALGANTAQCGDETITGKGKRGRCGGQAASMWQDAQVVSAASAPSLLVQGCNCDKVVWLMHQSGSNWRTARSATGQCT